MSEPATPDAPRTVKYYLTDESAEGFAAHATQHNLSVSALLRLVGRDAAAILRCPICGTLEALKAEKVAAESSRADPR